MPMESLMESQKDEVNTNTIMATVIQKLDKISILDSSKKWMNEFGFLSNSTKN